MLPTQLLQIVRSVDQPFEMSLNVWPDLFGLGAMEVLEDSLFPVKVEHGFRVVWENFQSVSHALWLVILPLDQILSSHIVFSFNLGWAKHQIVDSAGTWVHPAVWNKNFSGLKQFQGLILRSYNPSRVLKWILMVWSHCYLIRFTTYIVTPLLLHKCNQSNNIVFLYHCNVAKKYT